METMIKTQTVTMSIDGQQVTVPKGTTVLEAAKTLGIDIPTLCHLKELAPDGSCRMCVVEVEGGRKGGLNTACTAHCQEGMVVHTGSPRVNDSRRFILDLLLSNHKLECFSCGKNGDCKLQDYCMEYGIDDTIFTEGKGCRVTKRTQVILSLPMILKNASCAVSVRECANYVKVEM